MYDRAALHIIDRGAPLPAVSSLPTRDSVGAGGDSGVRHGSDGKLGSGYVQGGGPSHRRGKAVLLRVVVVRVCAFFLTAATLHISIWWLSCLSHRRTVG